MIEDDQRLSHWRRTAWLAALLLGSAIALVVAVPFVVDTLDAIIALGFPLGFYLAAQGIAIAFVVAAFWFAGRQEAIDRAHGATEDN